MREREVVRCGRCIGSGHEPERAHCRACLGYGWRWSDGRPPTLCPGGGASPVQAVTRVRNLPCGRGGETCPGCDRFTRDIGTDPDVVRTVDAFDKQDAA